MAFVPETTHEGQKLTVALRRAKYASSIKSSKSWLQKQIAIADSYEKEVIAGMDNKEFAQYMRSKLNKVFGKK